MSNNKKLSEINGGVYLAEHITQKPIKNIIEPVVVDLDNIDTRFYVTKEGFYRIGYLADIKDVNIEELETKVKELKNGSLVRKAERVGKIEDYIIIVDFPINLNIHIKGIEIMNSISWLKKIDSVSLMNYITMF